MVGRLSRRSVWMQAGLVLAHQASNAWQRLDEAERRDLRDLLARSRGRPSYLNKREQTRLRQVVLKTLSGDRIGQ